MLKDLPADLMRELEAVTAKAMFDEPAFAATEVGRHEIYVHLVHRLTEFRNNVMPWLGKHMTLDGARVLEIGAGTGSSVVALAESGAEVDAIDIMDTHLTVAAHAGRHARPAGAHRRMQRRRLPIRVGRLRSHPAVGDAGAHDAVRAAFVPGDGVEASQGARTARHLRDAEPPLVPRRPHLATAVLPLADRRNGDRLRQEVAAGRLRLEPARRHPPGAVGTRRLLSRDRTVDRSRQLQRRAEPRTSSCATPTSTTAKPGMPRSANAISSFWARSSPASSAPGAKRC